MGSDKPVLNFKWYSLVANAADQSVRSYIFKCRRGWCVEVYACVEGEVYPTIKFAKDGLENSIECIKLAQEYVNNHYKEWVPVNYGQQAKTV